MNSTYELEDRLIKLDRELHEILRSVKQAAHRGEHRRGDKESQKACKKIGSHCAEEKDTILLIREIRKKSYDL